jgi:polysaccharide export outer membrane protein
MFALITLLSSTSCIRYHEIVNYNQGSALPEGKIQVPAPPPFVVQPDDILQILIAAPDMQAAAPFNPYLQGPGNNAMLFNQNTGVGPFDYLVDKDGTIMIPVLGKVKVNGLTTMQVRDSLVGELRRYIKDPSVRVRVLNFRVTVAGEVTRPGPVEIREESITLPEVIGMAGNMTEFANRQNILLIREVAGERQYVRLNMQSTDFFQSDYYYLQQGDVVYIEPLPEKGGILSNGWASASDVIGRTSSFLSILLSILINTGVLN